MYAPPTQGVGCNSTVEVYTGVRVWFLPDSTEIVGEATRGAYGSSVAVVFWLLTIGRTSVEMMVVVVVVEVPFITGGRGTVEGAAGNGTLGASVGAADGVVGGKEAAVGGNNGAAALTWSTTVVCKGLLLEVDRIRHILTGMLAGILAASSPFAEEAGGGEATIGAVPGCRGGCAPCCSPYVGTLAPTGLCASGAATGMATGVGASVAPVLGRGLHNRTASLASVARGLADAGGAGVKGCDDDEVAFANATTGDSCAVVDPSAWAGESDRVNKARAPLVTDLEAAWQRFTTGAVVVVASVLKAVAAAAICAGT